MTHLEIDNMEEVNDYLDDKYPIHWKGERMRVEYGHYQINNSTSLRLISWDEDMAMEVPYMTASVYAEGVSLEEDEIVVKDYAENEGVLKVLVDNNIVNKPHGKVPLGYVHGHICQLIK